MGTNWQKIETIPTDRPVIIFDGENMVIVQAYKNIVESIYDFDVISVDGCEYDYTFKMPTHWHELLNKPHVDTG